MRATARGLIGVIVLLLPSSALGTETPAPVVSVETLPGNTRLVMVSMPGAATASFRYVVRSGSAADQEHPGLAHLVEHAIFHGSLDEGERGFASAVNLAGGTYNGHTRDNLTTYEIDAPRDALLPLAERLIRMTSSPALWPSEIDREVGVVDTESRYRQDFEAQGVEEALFPGGFSGGAAVTAATTRLSADMVRSFYEHEYLSSNTLLLVLGDLKPDAVRASVSRSFRLPPATGGESVERRSHREPDVPAHLKLRSNRRAILLAYALSEDDALACDEVSAVLSLRLLPLETKSALVTGVDVGCERVHGVPLLLVELRGLTRSADSAYEMIDPLIESVSTRPMTVGEQKLVAARLKVQAARRAANPELLATALISGLASPDATIDAVVQRAQQPRPHAPGELAHVAAHMLRVERRARVELMP